MGASAAAALWLLYRQAGDGALLDATLLSIFLIAVLAVYGRSQRGEWNLKWIALVAIAAILLEGVVIAPPHWSTRPQAPVGAEHWSEGRVANYVSQGNPVFVYFTADWCLTCKVNEAGAIDREEVRAAFKQAGVTVLVGDWTNGDPAITRFLESRGRAGVPFYLWYAPGKQPEELPQVLTPGMLISRAQSARL